MFKELSDISKDLRLALSERLSNPLLSSFFIAWSIFNYEFYIILFSDIAPMSKINTLNIYFNDNSNWLSQYLFIPGHLVHGIVYPLIAALAYIFLFPKPIKFVYEFWQERQVELQESKIRLIEKMPVSKERADQLKTANIDLTAKLREKDELISTYSSRINELNDEISNLKNSSSRDNNFDERVRDFESVNFTSDEDYLYKEQRQNDSYVRYVNYTGAIDGLTDQDDAYFSHFDHDAFSESDLDIILHMIYRNDYTSIQYLYHKNNFENNIVDKMIQFLLSKKYLDINTKKLIFLTEKGRNKISVSPLMRDIR